MTKYPFSKKADDYAHAVVTGKQPACEWIKLICQRHLDDLKGHELYRYDVTKAERVCKFIELMPHTKGKWAAQRRTIGLEGWQCFFLCNLFGWVKKSNGLRRYRKALLFVPRKNGKSVVAAGLGLYMLTADGEYGAEVYAGATTEKQAWEVFKPAKIMASKADGFKDHYGVTVNASNICNEDDGSKFEPMIGNPADGSSPHLAIIDELHEHKDSRALDTMETGMGAREQPLLLVITTAGDNIAGPCYDMMIDAQKILHGMNADDGFLPMLYMTDVGDDWESEDTLKKCNPNYGVSISAEFMQSQLLQARNNARKQSAFKTKHLNIWVGSKDAYYNIELWKSLADPSLKIEDFRGQRAFIGLDLASRVDIAAVEILLPDGFGGYVTFGKHYLPESQMDKENYRAWANDGLLEITDGDIIDFNLIKNDIVELCDILDVQEVAYDPFQATMLVTELMELNVPVVEMRAIVVNFSEPMKELDALIRSGKIAHDGNLPFTWMLSNVTGKHDKKDNVYPNKSRDDNKIDGPVALMMALGRAMKHRSNGFDDAMNNLISVNY